MGSYRPHNSITDLEKIRDILIEKGMKKAHLAVDFIQHRSQELTEAEYNYVNSIEQIKSCDFELFVFYGNRDNSGPATELQFSLQANFVSKVYVGIRSSDVGHLSSMIRGAIEHHKIVKYEFESLEDLASAFEGYINNKELS